MTNGEKLKEIFPKMEYEVKDNTVLTDVDNGSWFSLDWWNAEYQESTTKNDLGVDCVSRQFMLDLGATCIATRDKKGKLIALGAIEELPSVTPQEPRWIPLTKRPMTDEEREHYREWSDVEGAMIFDCPLPEDGQEVLVSHGRYVCVDVFCNDDGCYFEGVDIDDVDAWMPLPKPYEPQESENQ